MKVRGISMKYRFITIMHNMKLETVKNKGVSLFPGARISNGTNFLKETLGTNLMKYTAGVISLDEFNNTVYFYNDSEFKEIDTKEKMDKVGTNYTFFFLRQIESFLNQLWEIKDNNVYVRDGFLIVYDKTLEDGFTYKASLSSIYMCSTLDKGEMIFSDEELKSAISKYQLQNVQECQIEDVNYKQATDDHFFKHSKSERMDRALYFVLSARESHTLPMKIVSYCTALECLFTSTKSEVNHRIAERVALFIGSSIDTKKGLYTLIKKAYDVRSTIVHGSSLKGKSENLKDISKDLDAILRKLLMDDSSVFSKNDNELEDFFIDLLFSNYKSGVK